MITFRKRVTKDKREKKTKGIVFETMLHNSFYLTISKTQKILKKKNFLPL